MQRGLQTHVMDHNESGPKPRLVERLGARHHAQFPSFAPDIVVECTGVPAVIAQAICSAAPDGVVCLTGLSAGAHGGTLDIAALNQALVLENRVVFGSVNANLRHYRAGRSPRRTSLG
jgi:threonine dehydrogenase-like Zn-dependent dehydrogenase